MRPCSSNSAGVSSWVRVEAVWLVMASESVVGRLAINEL
jgi:hypothetical protein